jgi:indolepyruvate ferredoxin oxidoreductase
VARGLFKLMAYKDEYEVARLYTGESFRAQLKSQFEGDYSLRFHMAPPVFARKDPRTGVPRKMTLGPRTMTALKALARLKGLRGTWFDPFGHTAERKMERALIREYRQTIDQLLVGLNGDKIAQAATIAALAETIRGFGHVKAASVEKYRTELGRLMQSYTAPAPRDMPLRKTA